MNVSLLIITHGQVGQTLLDTAVSVIGSCPLTTEVIAINDDCDPDDIVEQAAELLQTLNKGDGVLILTDMYGSTPSNIGCTLGCKYSAVVSGINLPMLVRVLNYPYLGLGELVQKAISGGRDGVLSCNPWKPEA